MIGGTISMDGKGRWVDNVFVERLWRSLKYEDVYLRAYETPSDAQRGIERYFRFSNVATRPRTDIPQIHCILVDRIWPTRHDKE